MTEKHRDYNVTKYVSKFGFIGDIDAAGANEEVWIVEDAYTGFVAAAAATTVKSSSADDTSDGTGARTVLVEGLIVSGGLWVEKQETATLNGITAVNLTNQFIRVHRAYVVTAGTGAVNAGNIDILHTSTILARIGTGYGQTMQATYTIPDVTLAGTVLSTGEITRWYGTVGAVQSAFATTALQTKENGGAWRTRRITHFSEGAWVEEVLAISTRIPSKTDIRVRIIYNGANNTSIAAGFDVGLW